MVRSSPSSSAALSEMQDIAVFLDVVSNGSNFMHGGKFNGLFPRSEYDLVPSQYEDAETSNLEWDPLFSFPPPHSFFCPHPLRQAPESTLYTP